jgi:hypothetical protein
LGKEDGWSRTDSLDEGDIEELRKAIKRTHYPLAVVLTCVRWHLNDISIHRLFVY